MKITNFLEHPALNQLRLSMGAESVAAPPVGWQPRLLDEEAVMRLGQPDPAIPIPIGEDLAPSAHRLKTPRAVPVRYSRDRESSKILNPIGLPKGAIATDIIEDDPAHPTRQPSSPSPPQTLPTTPKRSPPMETQTASAPTQGMESHARRRRKNQSVLEALRRLEANPDD